LSQELFVGVDAGGTRTRLVLGNRVGELFDRVQGGPGNFHRLGAVALGSLIEDLLGQVRLISTPVVLCAGVAGAGRVPEQMALQQELEGRQLAGRILVVSDARAALEGAHGGAEGIVCIAGTGSMVLGRNAAGEEARAGGWGPVLGDEGSAYALVLEGVRGALRAVDGSGTGTQLQQDLLEALGLADWKDIIAAVYGEGLSRERLAEACPAVFAAARAGDRVAVDVIDAGGRALGAQVAAVARRLRLAAPVAVAGAGGVFAEMDRLRAPMAEGAARVAVQLGPPQLPAHLGALLLSLREAGVSLPDAALNRWALPYEA
jgi:N-acetylglucosamine kinase-like BadF-type ATPase